MTYATIVCLAVTVMAQAVVIWYLLRKLANPPDEVLHGDFTLRNGDRSTVYRRPGARRVF